MKTTKAAVIAAAEKLDWRVTFGEQALQSGKTKKYVEFERYSPAGEDLIITEYYHSIPEISDKLIERYNDFDPEQHAAEWYGANRGEPYSLQDLLDDARDIEDLLFDLAYALS